MAHAVIRTARAWPRIDQEADANCLNRFSDSPDRSIAHTSTLASVEQSPRIA